MDLMAARRRLMQMQELPSAYRRVEYLESSGTQYINTGIAPFSGIGFECEYLTNNALLAEGFGCIFGGRNAGGVNDFQFTTYSAPSGMFRYGSDRMYTAGIKKGIKQKVTLKQFVYTNPDGIQQEIQDYVWGSVSNPNPVSIYMFGLHSGSYFAQSGGGCRIYMLAIFNMTAVYAKFIPCVRKLDNEPGMYETVSKTFYTNAGTGEFIIPS